ncbi:nucleotidyltransferase domain-containing protein [Paucisalibacillus sp. EB02]|uniref:nucleotidyltransferase domain-containing protein n=1 Tax=Paucisalibacillus sp. EB02 TaxID=1347087 RepID=UPI0005AADF99|nr:nucleotidyltransferase domain-containing protein [Paucisalibacillus sp. EB02]
MGFKCKERDLALPNERKKLLEAALKDLEVDPNVIGIYEDGSLGRGDYDPYSDIDLHIVVKPRTKQDFIAEKKERASNWGNVLFYEGSGGAPYIVSHYDCFVKIDSWYHEASELQPSIWLKDVKAYYDPEHIVNNVISQSNKISFSVTAEDIRYWREKVFAYAHETYRATRRNELNYALDNLSSLKWLIASSWYTEKNEHLYNSYPVWSKIDREGTVLSTEQLKILAIWDCNRDSEKILQTIAAIYPEFLRLNKILSKKVGIEEDNNLCVRVFELIL